MRDFSLDPDFGIGGTFRDFRMSVFVSNIEYRSNERERSSIVLKSEVDLDRLIA